MKWWQATTGTSREVGRLFSTQVWLVISVLFSGYVQNTFASFSTLLTSTLEDGRRACPNDRITFTCVTNGSASHAWTSVEYIGQGGIQFEFAAYNHPGETRSNGIYPTTTRATLIDNVREENGTTVILESKLEITVVADYPTASITCLYVDNGTSTTTTFQLLDVPGEPEDVTVIETQRTGAGEMKNSCVLLLQLKPPSNINADDIDHYIINYQSGEPVTTADTSTNFVVSNCSLYLRIRVTAVNRCGVSGNSTHDIVPTFLPQSGGVDGTDQPSSIDNVGVVAIVVPVVILIILAIAVIATVVLIFLIYYKRKQTRLRREPDGGMLLAAGSTNSHEVRSMRRQIEEMWEEIRKLKGQPNGPETEELLPHSRVE